MNGSLWMSLSVVLLAWGVVGVLQKMAVDRIGARTALVWAAAGFILLQAVVLPTISVLNYSSKSLLCAVLNGIFNGLGILCLMGAMRHGGKASIVESLAALYPVFVVMLAPALLGERLSAFHLLGVGCAALAGVLLSAESPASSKAQIPSAIRKPQALIQLDMQAKRNSDQGGYRPSRGAGAERFS
jgi:bacterial/archaeal transporter family protein